ncbi:hypothetical protein K6V39_03320 [Streptococcus suis]|uniref:hypothetical protein n=1 Tax=Streptococcus suis TaxID=1307 RepID=UPI001C9528A6|nr:hypothetical protein [Streptococcus suis]MBY4961556.1 hypothetical protein [Streptococcus suis]MBY4967976.1 hypothetical protein [Streptococcus suis]MBY4979052.1 hypothetical protein [Streptococcus suis]MBY4987560.1 hypothetical protein [Streptococcus suis]MBY4994120.1 hypothetical protein [Streptococcus suis]
MSIINQLKSQSKTVLAAVAITAATVGFAGGMSISKSSTAVLTQSQAALAQNGAMNGQANSIAGNQMPPVSNGGMQGMPPGQNGNTQGLPPGQNGNSQGMTPPDATGETTQGMPSGRNGEMRGMPPGQGTTPPDATSGATQSNTSSDEVNALKEKNQEIKAQISGSSITSNQ